MRPAFYDGPRYKQKQSKITREYWLRGTFDFKRKPLEERECKNDECKSKFFVKHHDRKIFCSQSCAAKITNKTRIRQFIKKPNCLFCKEVLKRSDSKYCSLKCQSKYQNSIFITKWKQGLVDGNIGIKVRFVSGYLKRYLLEKYEYKCSLCSWNKINPSTGKVPLEVDHIDGNSENNTESNLRLLCPNCHSLTPTFKNLNKGNGRAWRLQKKNLLFGADNGN